MTSAVRSPTAMLTGGPQLPDAGESPWGDQFRLLLAAAGIEVEYVRERLTARPPSLAEAEALGISRGVAVLALERTSFDTQGRVTEVADAVMSGNRVVAVYTTPVGTGHLSSTALPRCAEQAPVPG